jgi:rRNA maturation endonuclease Nob1
MLIIYIVNLKVINNYGRKIIVPCEHCGKTLDLNQEDTCNYCGLSFLEPLVDVNLINML